MRLFFYRKKFIPVPVSFFIPVGTLSTSRDHFSVSSRVVLQRCPGVKHPVAKHAALPRLPGETGEDILPNPEQPLTGNTRICNACARSRVVDALDRLQRVCYVYMLYDRRF